MKKFLGILCVLLLASFPTLSQEPEVPILVPVSAYVESGMFLSIDPGTATWLSIPLPESSGVEEYVPSDEGAQSVYLSYRLLAGRTAKLVCESADVVYNEGPFTCDPAVMLKHTFAGDFTWESMLPPVLGEQEVYRGLYARDYVDATLLISFFNSDLPGENSIQKGTYASTITYTLMDILIGS